MPPPELPVDPGAGAVHVPVGLPSVQKTVAVDAGGATGVLCPAARWANVAEKRNARDFIVRVC